MNERTVTVSRRVDRRWDGSRHKERQGGKENGEGEEEEDGRAGGRRTKEEVSTCAGLQPLASHINTDTHAQHYTLLWSLNNASNRRDGAAAVATRERCGKAETEARGAARGLAGNQFCADVILPSLPLRSHIHPFIPSHHIPRWHAVICQYSRRERDRNTKREDISHFCLLCFHLTHLTLPIPRLIFAYSQALLVNKLRRTTGLWMQQRQPKGYLFTLVFNCALMKVTTMQ